MSSFPSVRRKHQLLLWVIFPKLLLFSVAGCNRGSTPEFSLSDPKMPLTVNVFRPSKTESAIKTASYFGNLEPNRRITVGFTVGGKIKSIAQNRQSIAKDQIIAQLEDSDLVDKRNELQTRLEQLRSELRETANTQQLEAQIATLDQQIQQRKLLAPFDCFIERQLANGNTLVGPNSPVVQIAEAVDPKIKINLPRRVANVIYPGNEFFFVLGGELIKGQLKEQAMSENPPGCIATWFDVNSDLSNIEFAFGQSVEIKFVLPTGVSGYWLPLSSLRQSSNGLWSVFFIEQKGDWKHIRQQLVTIDQIRDDAALVTDDLADKLVVLNGIHRVVNNQQVETNLVPFEVQVAGQGSVE